MDNWTLYLSYWTEHETKTKKEKYKAQTQQKIKHQTKHTNHKDSFSAKLIIGHCTCHTGQNKIKIKTHNTTKNKTPNKIYKLQKTHSM